MSTRDAASAASPPSPGGMQGDAFDMLKNMWSLAGMAAIPGMSQAADLASSKGPLSQVAKGFPPMMPNLLVPTFDVDELDKRITDLRAVEQWLQLNASMLRATIQSLEVQRATVATLQQFGNAMLAPAKAAKAAATEAPSAPEPATAPPAALDPAAWWNSLQQQFSQIAAATAAGAAAAAGSAASSPPSARSTRKRSRG
jgi:hypothetical protein